MALAVDQWRRGRLQSKDTLPRQAGDRSAPLLLGRLLVAHHHILRGDLSAAAVMLICLALPRRLFVKLARPFKLAGKLHSIPMNDDTPELKGWRRNQNGTYTPISSETIEDVKARSPERRIALGVLRQHRATDSIEGMSTEYLSMLTPEDDPRVTIELVEKARQARSGGFSNSSISIGPRGGMYEMRVSSKGRIYRHYY